MTRAEFYSNLMNYQKVQNDPDAETIKHYGIIGQKWGQRRWQNADGTFNTEGKIRYFGSQKAQAEKMQNEKVGGFGFREIRTNEKNLNLRQDEGPKGYQKIKPDQERSAKELMDMVAEEFEKVRMGSQDNKKSKIGGWWQETKAKMLPGFTSEGDLKHIKKYADYYDVDGLTDDEILKVIRRTKYSNNLYNNNNGRSYADVLNEELHQYKKDKALMEYAKANTNLADKAINDYIDSQKVGGFGNIKNKEEADRAYALLEKEYDKACHDILDHYDEYDKYDSRARAIMKQMEELDEKFGGQPGGKKLNEKETINDTIKGIFSKKNKSEDTIKKLEEEGKEDLAKEYKKHAKDLDQYKKIGSQPGMSEEERKATRRACANCWKVAMRNKWPLFFLFGILGGGVIGAIASNSKINKMIDQLGLDRQDKDKFTADDWDKITEAIKDSRRKKPKNA